MTDLALWAMFGLYIVNRRCLHLREKHERPFQTKVYDVHGETKCFSKTLEETFFFYYEQCNKYEILNQHVWCSTNQDNFLSKSLQQRITEQPNVKAWKIYANIIRFWSFSLFFEKNSLWDVSYTPNLTNVKQWSEMPAH